MKILQVTPAFIPSEFGGIKIQSYYLSRELVKRGHDVTVYTSNARNTRTNLDRKGRYDVDGIKVVYFNNCLPNRYLLLFFTPGIVGALKDELRGYDIVHLHGIRTFPSLATHHYCARYRIPYVLTPHGSLPAINNWVLLKKVYDCVLGNKAITGASRLIATTAAEAEQFKTSGLETGKIVQSSNGIDIDEFGQLPERGNFRKNYNITEKKIILFLGRIHKIKGLDILAAAFAELLADGEEVRLVIAGQDYGYRDELIKTLRRLNVESGVTFTGFLSGRAKMEAYIDSDVYVLPSVYESFSTTVLEALACGIPVIVTDRCYLADTISGQAGLVVPYDKEPLRQALRQVLGDDRMRRQLGEKGRKLVREQFNWERIAGQIETVYQSCCRH
jgi:glycosyltransferase involved in cell wall biosynthesis